MSARVAMTACLVGGCLVFAFAAMALAGLQIPPMCCVRRYAAAAFASARPLCAVAMPVWVRVHGWVRP